MFNIVDSQIAVSGDWHGDKAWAKVALYTLADYGINIVLHVGDFGFWPGNSGQKYLHYVNKVLKEKNMTLIVTLGNHEDYVQISRFTPHPDHPGFVYDENFPNILVANRGTRWNLEGVSFMSLGGGNSIDYAGRTEWVNWWKAERISLADVYAASEGGYADVMITHDCPAGVDIFGSHRDAGNGWSKDAISYAVESRYALRQVLDNVKPEILFHGHYHMNLDKTTTFFENNEPNYTVRTVGMNMNGSKDGNIGIFNLKTKEFERVDIEWTHINKFYKKQPITTANGVIRG